MADTLITNIPESISAATNEAKEVMFHSKFNSLMGVNQAVFIKVVSGTFKFNVGGAASASGASYTSSDTVPPIPVNNGNCGLNLFYQCTSAGSFNISFIGGD